MPVLIAKDDSALANFVRKGLEAEHYAVDVTTDGEQARALAGEMDYDLLMLDLNLPRVDGIAILRHLRTRKPIALSYATKLRAEEIRMAACSQQIWLRIKVGHEFTNLLFGGRKQQ